MGKPALIFIDPSLNFMTKYLLVFISFYFALPKLFRYPTILNTKEEVIQKALEYILKGDEVLFDKLLRETNTIQIFGIMSVRGLK